MFFRELVGAPQNWTTTSKVPATPGMWGQPLDSWCKLSDLELGVPFTSIASGSAWELRSAVLPGTMLQPRRLRRSIGSLDWVRFF